MKLKGSDRPRPMVGITLPLVWGVALLWIARLIDWILVSYIFYEFPGYFMARHFATLGALVGLFQWYAGWRRGFALAALILTMTAGWAWTESSIYSAPLDFGEGPAVCYAPPPFSRPFRDAECRQQMARDRSPGT